MSVLGCTGLLDPVCQAAGSAGSSIVGAGASSILGAVASWVVDGASWLLGQIGNAITSTTSVDLGVGWFTSHYQVMAGLAGVVMLPLLLVSAVQAVYRQSAATLVRTVAVQLPLALVLAAVGVQLVQLALAATDALGSTVATGVGVDIQQALSGVASNLASQAAGGPASAPTFVVLLAGLLVACGAFLLWLELLVRSAAVYVAVLFLPLALASLVWPAISHWCRRLVDTLVALVLAKFVIMAILSLAAAALASGTQSGFAAVLGGAALLLLAAFAPFTLLRLVPAVEAGAVQQLEGARHRVQQVASGLPRSAADHVLQEARAVPIDPGEPGTGLATTFGVPGGGGDAPATGPGPGGAGGPGDAWAGDAWPGADDRAGESTGADEQRHAAGHRGPGGSRRGSAGRRRLDAGRGPTAGGPHGPPAEPDDGMMGIPMWQGRPVDLDSPVLDEPVRERAEGELADPRGPVPVWGAPAPDLFPEVAGRDPLPRTTIRRDEMGPVIAPATGGDREGDRPPADPGGRAAEGDADLGGATSDAP